MRMPFGKYRDIPLDEVPGDYLAWAYRTVDFRSEYLRHAIAAEMMRRAEQDVARQEQRCDRLARRWYNDMARRWHPDRGGSQDGMKAVNDGYELLKRLLAEYDGPPAN